jgi:hypothetical protein
MEEDSTGAKPEKGNREQVVASALGLAAGLDNQDHARAEDGDVAIVALQGCDRGFVGGGDGVQSFATLYRVAEHSGLAGSVFFSAIVASASIG